MMVVWIKCFECTHFACERTGRFDCAAFLPQKGIPAPVYGAPIDRICSGIFKFERADEVTIKNRAKLGFANIETTRKDLPTPTKARTTE